GRNGSGELGIERLPCLGFGAAEIAIAPLALGVPQPTLDCAPVGRVAQQRDRVRCSRSDEFLSASARPLARRRLLREITRRGCVSFIARMIEAVTQRIRYCAV